MINFLQATQIQRGGESVSKVEETIEVLCDWIQVELKSDSCIEKSTVAAMVNALANLVASRYQPERCD